MKKLISLFVLCAVSCGWQLAFSANNSPIGYWKIIDDVTGKAKSIIQIWQRPDKRLNGKLVTIYPDPGKDIYQVCTACQGEKHNQRILGMVIMEGLKQDKENPNLWNGAWILDPRNGKTYHFNVTVVENGNKLNARGYIGLPLFGRTQTWLRVQGADG